jgi:hypothetical protein
MKLGTEYTYSMRFVLLLFAWLIGASAGVDAAEQKLVLKGSVERHAQIVTLKSGMAFNKDMLPKPGTAEFWYALPDWFAGTWYRDEIHELTDKGEVVSTSRAEGSRGRLRDPATGRIIDRLALPMVATVDEVTRQLYFINREVEILQADENKVTLKLSGDVLTIDPATGTVQSILPHSETLTATPNGDRRIRVEHEKQDGGITKRAYNDEWQIHPFSPSLTESTGSTQITSP